MQRQHHPCRQQNGYVQTPVPRPTGHKKPHCSMQKPHRATDDRHADKRQRFAILANQSTNRERQQAWQERGIAFTETLRLDAHLEVDEHADDNTKRRCTARGSHHRQQHVETHFDGQRIGHRHRQAAAGYTWEKRDNIGPVPHAMRHVEFAIDRPQIDADTAVVPQCEQADDHSQPVQGKYPHKAIERISLQADAIEPIFGGQHQGHQKTT